jgi:hypothetical protein
MTNTKLINAFINLACIDGLLMKITSELMSVNTSVAGEIRIVSNDTKVQVRTDLD